MERVIEGLAILSWFSLWGSGGWLLAGRFFRLRPSETAMIGVGLGLVLQTWLANLISPIVAVPASFWLAAACIFLAGITAVVLSRSWPLIGISPWAWLVLAGLTLLFNAIGRGLGVFDDYQNLPTVSIMAAGDVPPHFALDPVLRFGYHHFLLLFAAELMVLGDMFPWSALDLARALVLALPLVLTAMWGYRLSRNRMAAFLGSCVLAFAGGARWLLLLLPPAWLDRVSREISLIGSAASSAPNLAQALISAWKIDGDGPIPFPFAFHSGISAPYVMAHTGIAGSGVLIILLLLLTAERWKGAGGMVISSALLAALALANEISYLLVGLGLLLAGIVWIAMGRRPAPKTSLLPWLAAMTASLCVGVVQGGMLTEMVRSRLLREVGASSYFDPTPTLVWPPALVSAHLGSLSMLNLPHLVAAFVETGPLVMVTPLVLAWGWRCLKRGNWFETSLIASSLGALIPAFVSFKGPLFTAAPRLMSGWFLACALFFVPLLWVVTRNGRENLRISAMVIGFIGCLGGIVLLGVQLAAIQKPVYATFITPMDAQLAEDQWNRLPTEALVFDPLVFRAPTVLGRPTKSSPTWYIRSEAWERLKASANPYELRAAGFTHMYIDSDYWEQLSSSQQAALGETCVRQLGQVDGIHSEIDYTKDFRRLLDISACE